jgi:hypothetical protein
VKNDAAALSGFIPASIVKLCRARVAVELAAGLERRGDEKWHASSGRRSIATTKDRPSIGTQQTAYRFGGHQLGSAGIPAIGACRILHKICFRE